MVEVKICIGTSCHLKGSYNIMTTFLQMVEKYQLHEKVNVQGSFCKGNCQAGVCVTVNGEICSVNPLEAKQFFTEKVLPLAQ